MIFFYLRNVSKNISSSVDPIHIAGQPLNLPNSVLKLTTDTFSSKAAADLFYTNDIKVLIDIVTRCVTDLGPGDKVRKRKKVFGIPNLQYFYSSLSNNYNNNNYNSLFSS